MASGHCQVIDGGRGQVAVGSFQVAVPGNRCKLKCGKLHVEDGRWQRHLKVQIWHFKGSKWQLVGSRQMTGGI